jgi:predicted phage tail protein
MLRTVHLHGAAAQRFGGPFRFDVETPIEAVRALCSQLRGFQDFLKQADWQTIKGPWGGGREIVIDEFGLRFGHVADLHLVPVPAGASKGKGFGKIALGAAIAIAAVALSIPSGGGSIALGAAAIGPVAGFSVSFGSIALAGVGIALGGVSQLLASTPQVKGYSGREAADVNRPSFLFNGPVNSVVQGTTIPVLCGRRIRVGSVVISAGIFTERFVPTAD